MALPDRAVVRFLKPQLPPPDAVERYLAAAHEERWYSNEGPCQQLLARRLADYVDKDVHCVPVANATLGLMLALRALARSDDRATEVLVPSFTFIATVSAIEWVGLQPVFLDVDPEHWHLRPDALEGALRRRGRTVAAVLACSTFGAPPPTDISAEWQTLCASADVPLIVDSASGFGAQAPNGMVLGMQGAAEIFSFHATKTFAIGEGGAVVTRFADVAERLRRMANFGFDSGRRLDDRPSINAKMSEHHAAIGLAVLDRYPEILEARRTRSAKLRAGLESLGCSFQRHVEHSTHQFVPVLAPTSHVRERILDAAVPARVQVRTYFEPLHQFDVMMTSERAGTLAVTEDMGRRILSLPMANDLSDEEIGRVRDVLLGVLASDSRAPSDEFNGADALVARSGMPDARA